MKRILFSLIILIVCSNYINAQQRSITRGAIPGEFYFTNVWYANYGSWGPPFYDSLFRAIYHLTENGKKLTIQYYADYFADYYTEPGLTMHPDYILADATPGVLYNSDFDPLVNDRLWFSDDYGKTWELRDTPSGAYRYYISNFEGLIYRSGGGIYKSTNYGETFSKMEGVNNTPGNGELGWEEEEAFGVGATGPYKGILTHTYDFYKTYTEIPIDSQFMYGSLAGYFPGVYRGGLPGEVYIKSPFPGNICKISFSADTGQSFRVVYQQKGMTDFMSDRKAGDFYIVNQQLIETTQPWGYYNRICIDYYTDYGEILEAVFCHDLVRDYEYVEKLCEHTTDLISEVINENSIHLQWSNTASNIRGYHVFRNDMRITKEMLTEPFYLDENLPDGVYEYYVRVYYEYDCPSDSSNHVIKTIGTCEPVNDLTAEKINDKTILLTWTEPEEDLEVDEYGIFRNDIELAERVTNTFYLDENLPVGEYEYYVITYYVGDCVSDSSNHVRGVISVGIEEMRDGIAVYPNPTKDGFKVSCLKFKVSCIEIFDLMGRNVETWRAASPQTGTIEINISNLPSGMYFVRIRTENGVVTRKVVKR